MPILPNEFHILNAQADHKDVSRNWMWELTIPSIGTIVKEISTMGLATRIKTATIPGAEIDPIEVKYMGTTQYYPGMKKPTTEMSCSFTETEDQYVYAAFQSWQTLIQNLNHTQGNAGSALMASKANGYALDMFLTKYTYDGAQERLIQFYNAWPKSLGTGSLSYDASGAVEYEVSFQFDNYEIIA